MSKLYGPFKIINNNSGKGSNGSKLFDIQFLNTCYIAKHVRRDHIKDGNIKDRTFDIGVIGKTFTSKSYGDFKVLYEVRRNSHNIVYRIKFIKTGYETDSWLTSIRAREVLDPLYPRVQGVGYLGLDYYIIRKQDSELYKALKQKWQNMFNRCYNSNYDAYKSYGAIGVTIDKRWHNFSNFYKDAQKLDGYNREAIISNNGIHLDKDLKQLNIPKENRVYSKDTCTWLKPSVNIKLAVTKNSN